MACQTANQIPRRRIAQPAVLAILLAALPAGKSFAAATDRVDFNHEIRPILSDRCFTCHCPDEKSRKAKLRLDTKEGLFKSLDNGLTVVNPGDATKSDLVRRIFATDDDQMPPEKSKLKLSAVEKELIKRWVAQGAVYKGHWAFNPIEPITPPKPRSVKGSANAIDLFVRAKLEKEKLKPAPEASREILIRRLALNLTGLPPPTDEFESFLKDKSPDA